jgi:hypothetical protein
MNEASFTKGPWRITDFGEDGVMIHGSNGELVETVYTGKANAQLIASAPEIYEALNLMCFAFSKPVGQYRTNELQAYLMGRAALKKARGETA